MAAPGCGRERADLTAPLDGQQRLAVEAEGPVLVYAGPGTGKTWVVTRRIAHQVATERVAPGSVLAVTFTERAGGELLSRLGALGVSTGAGGVRAGTFHSAALRQVTWFWPRVNGGSAPTVLESKLALLVPLLKRAASPAGAPASGSAVSAVSLVSAPDLAAEIEWVKSQGIRLAALADDVLPPALAELDLEGPAPRWVLDVRAYASALACHQGPWPRDLDRHAAAEAFARVFNRYEEVKAASGRVDFEDMLATCCALVAGLPEVADAVRGRYTHFVVDEFQDVNRLQWDLLRAWQGEREDVFVVGDANQAIYGFSGASPAYLQAFHRRHPDATVVTLRSNYRSTQPVLDLAAQALGRPADRLRAVRGDGPRPLLKECADDRAERDWVLRRCRALRKAGVPWHEMAVLYRFNAQSEEWERALSAAGIPYVVRGDEAFFSRRHVGQALAALKVAERAGEGDVAVDDPRVALDGVIPARPRLDRLVPRILSARMAWREQAPEGGQARARWSDLRVLVDLAAELVRARPQATLAEFLAELDRRADPGAPAVRLGVNLMTLHRAKGLEFDAVFVVSVEEGRLPSRFAVEWDEQRQRAPGRPERLADAVVATSEVAESGVAESSVGESGVAEENRLFYVGVTRARTYLHVTWASGAGRRPSRFLGMLPGGAATSSAQSRAGRTPPKTTAPGRPPRSGAAARRRRGTAGR